MNNPAQHYPRSVLKRATRHLLYVLHVQQEVCYSQDCNLLSEYRKALIRGNGVDAAWFWPESLIHQAAGQLEHAGIATIALLPGSSPGSGPTIKITVTAKGEKLLRSGKAFRCRMSKQSPCATSNSATQTSLTKPCVKTSDRPAADSTRGFSHLQTLMNERTAKP